MSRRPDCDVAGCGREQRSRRLCNTHYRRWQRHGDPQAHIPVEVKTSGGTGYWAAHERVKTERGPAIEHRCAECGQPATVWSYDGTDPDERIAPGRGYRYSLDPAHYRPRCRSCHRRATVAARRPKPRSAQVVDVERAARLYEAGASVRGIASLLGTSPPVVYRALRSAEITFRTRGTRTRRT